MNDNTKTSEQAAEKQVLSFQAEVKQLMQLVAKSLYSNREIFLRELVSNASDALDKLRHEALTNSKLYEDDSTLKIRIEFDKVNRTITVSDNGIGLSRDEAVKNLGTIAESGTRVFREMLGKDQTANSELIGQFGVGFYSAFVVADYVVVRSRRAGLDAKEAVQWESDGQGEFSVKPIEKTSRGTEVVLHLKKEDDEFLEPYRLRNIIRKYSDHISFPIEMEKPQEDKDEKTTQEWEVVNRANALWKRAKNEITDEEYKEFYKHVGHDFEDPLAWSHNAVEGKNEYTSLLYIPNRAPFNLWQQNQKRGLKLYVKRVFIMDDAEQFLPFYMRFVKGIIDSNDLPLNISREILQSNKNVDRIRAACVKRILSLLEQIAESDKEKYNTFWKEFGSVLKEGPAEDHANKDRIAKLLRFSSTHDDSEKEETGLSDYISRMPAEQEKIYYVIADTFTAAKNSPLLEVFRKKGIEVLLLHHPVDEWLVSNLHEFEGKQLQSISQGALDLGKLEDKEEKKQQEQIEKAHTDFVKKIQDALGEKVKEVRITHRLTDSPACVVYGEQDLTAHMQRLLKAAGQAFAEAKPILEINPEHPIIRKIKEEKNDAQVTKWADILLSQALLAEGEQLKDPAGFVKQLNSLLLNLA